MKSLMLLLVILGIGLRATSTFSQAPTQAMPSFEVASIRPCPPRARQRIAIEPGGQFIADGVSLQLLIAIAYRLQAFQMSGGERWMSTDQWSIQAETWPGEVSAVPAWAPPYVPPVIAASLRSLLKHRFALKTHWETKRLRVYTLMLGKHGSKLKAVHRPPLPGRETTAAPQPGSLTPNGASSATPMPPDGSVLGGPGLVVGSAASIEQLVAILGRLMDRVVINETGLTGFFDFRLQFDPDSAPLLAFGAKPANALYLPTGGTGGPSIFTAVQEQLGLKLEPKKEPIHVLVIDSALKPTKN
jgi:bla regulator protein blaR1